MASGDIVVNMIGQNSLTPAVMGSIGALGGLNSAIDRHIGRLVGQTKAQQAFNQMLDDTFEEMKDLETVQNNAGRGAAAVGANMSKAAGGVNQLVFAVDDAIAGFSTGGFAGAIRGAGNNISTFAMQVGGAKAAMVGIGAVAGAQLLVPFITELQDAISVTKDLEERLNGIRQHGSDRRDAFETEFRRAGIGQRVNDITSPQEADRRLKELQNERARLTDVDIASKRKDIEQFDREINRIVDARNVVAVPASEALGTMTGLAEQLPFVGGGIQFAREYATDKIAGSRASLDSIQTAQAARDRANAELNSMMGNRSVIDEEISALRTRKFADPEVDKLNATTKEVVAAIKQQTKEMSKDKTEVIDF